MGDAEEETESALLQGGAALAADVLVVGHHGSGTGSGEAFLSAVSPRIAVISVGEDNNYNLPDTAVLTRLKALECAVYRTDLQGTVTVVSDGAAVTASPAK